MILIEKLKSILPCLLITFWSLYLLLFSCNPPDPVVDLGNPREVERVEQDIVPSPYPPHYSRMAVDVSWDFLLRKRDTLAVAGFNMVDVETYKIGGDRCYAGIWQPGQAPHRLWKADGWAGFQEKWNEYDRVGLLLSDFEVFLENGNRKIVGIWRVERGKNRFRSDLNWKDFVKARDDLEKEGFKLVDLEVYATHGAVKYAGLWKLQPNEKKYKIWKASSWGEFQRKWREFGGENYRMFDFEIFYEGGVKKYAGLWSPGKDNFSLWAESDYSSFIKKRRKFNGQQLQFIDLEVESGTTRSFSGVWRYGNAKFRDTKPDFKELETGKSPPTTGSKPSGG